MRLLRSLSRSDVYYSGVYAEGRQMLQMAVGHSDDVDPQVGISIAIDECRSSLREHQPTAGLLFSTADSFDPALIVAVRRAFPEIQLVGSTSSAEISSIHGYQEDSIVLALFASDTLEIGTGLGSGLGLDLDRACRSAVVQALAAVTLEPKVCVVLHESFVVEPSLIVESLTRALPEGVMVLGGASARSDFMTVSPTYQFRNETVATDGIATMVFCGPVAYSTAVGMGFKTIGSRGTVTRVEGGALQEIDGRPAVDFLRRYVDVTGPAAYANPLAVFEGEAEDFYLRAIQPSEPGSGSLMSAGGVPLGAEIQVTTADSEEVLAGTREAVERALEDFPSGATPEAAIIFSCAVRKFFLGSRTHMEAEIARSLLGELPTVGLYCYGEVGRVPGLSQSHVLNETFVTLLLGT